MKRFLAYIITIIVLSAISASGVYAQETAFTSATLKVNEVEGNVFDYRVENLRNFLSKFNSPIAAYADVFVDLADANGLDYRLVPSITVVESTFGKQIPYNSYNAYGWVNGNYSFKSWPESINIVTSTLKSNYVDHGLTSISQIARVYAPPSNTWGTKVEYFVKKIDALPLSFDII